ncbi:S8 family serine peptidase [Wukongibacter baidiensis]|uniref:S8 family serine peptidase n=1 Tax=Wukongibacter baidiensis TaxID=1723361 RepID=UPI003D7FF1F3
MKNMFNGKKIVAGLLCTLMVSSLMTYGFANDDGIIKEGKEKMKEFSIQKKSKDIKTLFDNNKDKLVESLSVEMDKVKGDEKLPVIVVFKEDLSMTKSSDDSVRTLLSENKTKYEFKNIPAVAMELSKDQISDLSKSDAVEHIEYDEEIIAFNDTADYWFGTEKARTDFGLDGDRDGNLSSYSKDDVVVAVIDTGIDADHVDLDGGKVIAWKDYINDKTSPYDDNGHGTHVAGTIAGEGDGNSKYEGVAKGAALIGLKVLAANGTGPSSGSAAAVDWCITNKDTYGIDIISMSLGVPGSSDGTDATSLAVNKAVENGITVVVAAGNEGPTTYTIGAPAAASKAITVGNMIDVGEDGFGLAFLSSRGPTADGRMKPDIGAPGTNITSPKTNSGDGYVTYSGTSMATPFTSGTIALMLDANENLTPTQIKNIITSTAEDWSENGQDVDYGHGRLDGYKAIEEAGGFNGTNIATPDHMYASEDLAQKGAIDTWEFTVDNTDYPISITLIMPDWKRVFWSGKPDFDVYLYDPSGNQVEKSTSSARQENIGFKPTSTGTYQIKVYAYSDSGDYFFDLSAGGSNLKLVQDQ